MARILLRTILPIHVQVAIGVQNSVMPCQVRTMECACPPRASSPLDLQDRAG